MKKFLAVSAIYLLGMQNIALASPEPDPERENENLRDQLKLTGQKSAQFESQLPTIHGNSDQYEEVAKLTNSLSDEDIARLAAFFTSR
jgi:cytochrome c553